MDSHKVLLNKHYLSYQELEDDVIPVPAGFVIQSPMVGPFPSPNVTPDGFQWQPAPLPQIDIPTSSPVIDLVPLVKPPVIDLVPPVIDLVPPVNQNESSSGMFVPSNSNQVSTEPHQVCAGTYLNNFIN